MNMPGYSVCFVGNKGIVTREYPNHLTALASLVGTYIPMVVVSHRAGVAMSTLLPMYVCMHECVCVCVYN